MDFKQDQEEAGNPPVTCQAVLLCESVIRDEFAKKTTIVGIVLMVNNPIVLVPVKPPGPIDPDCGESQQDMLDRIAAERLTPPSSALRDMARKSMPPQEWWDEDFDSL